MMGYDGYGYGMTGYGWGWLMMVGVLVLVIVGIVAFVKYTQNSGQASNTSSNTRVLDILNERYAKGELTDEEYKKKKAEILRNV